MNFDKIVRDAVTIGGTKTYTNNAFTDFQEIPMIIKAFAVRNKIEFDDKDGWIHLINQFPDQDVYILINLYESALSLIVDPTDKMKRLHELKWQL